MSAQSKIQINSMMANRIELSIGLSGNIARTAGQRREIDLRPASGILLPIPALVVHAGSVRRPVVLPAGFVVATEPALPGNDLPYVLASVSRRDSDRTASAPLFGSAVQSQLNTRSRGTARTKA